MLDILDVDAECINTAEIELEPREAVRAGVRLIQAALYNFADYEEAKMMHAVAVGVIEKMSF